jgi:hypothetical protein
MASLNPDLSELDVEKIRQSEDRFGEERATTAGSELYEAIPETKSILTSLRQGGCNFTIER